jgi:hypothetical protein
VITRSNRCPYSCSWALPSLINTFRSSSWESLYYHDNPLYYPLNRQIYNLSINYIKHQIIIHDFQIANLQSFLSSAAFVVALSTAATTAAWWIQCTAWDSSTGGRRGTANII